MNNLPNYFVATLAQSLASGGSENEVYVNSLSTFDGQEISISNFIRYGSVGYLIVDAQSSNSVEYIKFTGIDSTGVGFTGITRGLSSLGDGSVISDNKRFHPVGATVIIGWSSYDFDQFMDLHSEQTVDTTKNFSVFPIKTGTLTPTSAAQFATKAYVDAQSTGHTNYDQEVIAGVSGEAIATLPMVLYLKEADQRWYKADQASTSTSSGVIIGTAQSTTSGAGVAINVLRSGLDASYSSLTPGSRYYVGTSGALTTSPTNTEKFVGVALSATQLLVDLNFKYLPTALQKSALSSVETPGASNLYVTQKDLQDGLPVYAIATGSTPNNFGVSFSPTPQVYTAAQRFLIKAHTTISGSATIMVNGQSPRTIKKWNGSTNLAANDIISGQVFEVIDDGTNYQLLSPTGSDPAFPKIKFYTIFESTSRGSGVVVGGGTKPTLGATGMRLDTSNGSGSASNYTFQLAGSSAGVFSAGGVFSAMFNYDTLTVAASIYLGLGTVTSDALGHHFTTNHIGFKVIASGGIASLYGTVGNGTESATPVLTTIVNTDLVQVLAIINSSSSVDFYYRKNNGSLSTASNISSNIPTANGTATFQASINNEAANNDNAFTISSMGYEQ